MEGTNLVAHGQPGAITVLAASEAGGLTHAPDTYMEKLCVGPVAAGQVDIRATPDREPREHRALARAARSADITVVILERPRHDALIAEVKKAGARIKLIGDGDLSAAISCAVSGTGVHAVMGTGGAPEGVITAAALRCLGGEIQARFRYRSDDERERGARMGHGDEDRVYRTEDLAPGREPRLRGDRGDRRRPPPGRPLLRWRGADPLAGDGLRGQAGPLRRHGPHVRPRQPASGPALGMVMRYGYKASAEQFPPRRLLDLAIAAERAGFESVWTSDHFQPWRHTDGHAPNALVWLGAAAQATERVTLGTSVLTPSFRYNPAVVAQAFATLGLPRARAGSILGVGTGESLNEIPVGIEWPEQSERFARLKESVTLIQQLFREEFVTFEGEYYRTHNATIYDRPDEPVPIYIAASGPAAARLAGRIGDGLICTSGKGPELYTETLLPAVEEGAAKAGRDAGGLGRMIEMKVSFDTDRARAMEDTKIWAALALPGEQKVGVEDPREMERLAKTVEDVAHRRWLVSSDADEHVEQIATYVEYGFDHLVFHFPGDDQEAAIARYEELILPRLRARFG